MGMWASSKFYTGGFDFLQTNANMIVVNTTQVATASSALNDKLAATSSGAGALASTDITYSTGDASGYKATIASFSNLPVTSTGSADHITLIASSSSELMYITTCNSKNLTTSDTVTIPAWDIEIASPTS
jgi:hypothetical protein